MPRRQLRQEGDEPADERAYLPGFVPDVQPHVQGHLVVARARRVQLAARLADPLGQGRFYVHVDVLAVDAELEAALGYLPLDFPEPPHNGSELLPRQQAYFAEHPGVRDGAPDVLPVEAPVEVNGR